MYRSTTQHFITITLHMRFQEESVPQCWPATQCKGGPAVCKAPTVLECEAGRASGVYSPGQAVQWVPCAAPTELLGQFVLGLLTLRGTADFRAMHLAAPIEGSLAIAAPLVNTQRSALMALSAERTLPSTAAVVAFTAVLVVAFMAAEVEDFMVVAAVADMVVAVAAMVVAVADTRTRFSQAI